MRVISTQQRRGFLVSISIKRLPEAFPRYASATAFEVGCARILAICRRLAVACEIVIDFTTVATVERPEIRWTSASSGRAQLESRGPMACLSLQQASPSAVACAKCPRGTVKR